MDTRCSGEVVGVGMEWEIGIDVYTLLCIKQLVRTYIAQGIEKEGTKLCVGRTLS